MTMTKPRYFPNTRASAEEVKRSAWQNEGVLVVDVEAVIVPFDVKETLKQVGEKLYGPRRPNVDSMDSHRPHRSGHKI